jgi:hypothetical protein
MGLLYQESFMNTSSREKVPPMVGDSIGASKGIIRTFMGIRD